MRKKPPAVGINAWDLFYGHAMSGLLASGRFAHGEAYPETKYLVQQCSEIADAMVAARPERDPHGKDEDDDDGGEGHEEEGREEDDDEDACPRCREREDQLREESIRLGEAILGRRGISNDPT